MNNYKKWFPIVLVFLLILSCYKLVSDAKTKENLYFSNIEKAEEKSKEGIYVDAFKFYKQAFDMYQTVELADKMAKVVSLQGEKRDEVKWGKYMIERYPTHSNGYEYLMEVYHKEEKYKDCFKIYEKARKRQTVSEKMNKIKEIIEYEYEMAFSAFEDVGIYSGGYCAVKKDEKWGYANELGELMISPKFANAGAFGTMLAPVVEESGESYFVDKEGNKAMVLPENTKGTLGFYENGVYALNADKEASYYNEKSEAILKGYQEATTFNHEIAGVKKGEDWVFIKTDGTQLSDATYQEIALDEKGISFRNERAFAKTQDGYVLVDTNGAVVGTQKYDDAKPFLDTTYAAVKVGIKWGFIDKNGQLIIEPTFEEAQSFSNGLAAVQIHNLWGYIDVNGTVVIEPVFDGGKPFLKNGCTFVKNNSQWSLLKLLRSNY